MKTLQESQCISLVISNPTESEVRNLPKAYARCDDIVFVQVKATYQKVLVTKRQKQKKPSCYRKLFSDDE
jgi:hypothetical protein